MDKLEHHIFSVVKSSNKLDDVAVFHVCIPAEKRHFQSLGEVLLLFDEFLEVFSCFFFLISEKKTNVCQAEKM